MDRVAAIGAALDDIRVMVANLRELNPGDPDDRHDLDKDDL